MPQRKAALPSLTVLVTALTLVVGVQPCLALPSWGQILHPSKGRDGANEIPVVATYESDAGAQFVLDRSWSQPLLRYQGSQEVLVLRGARTNRGDIILRDDTDRPVLRLTNYGGMTLFDRGRAGGEAVSRLGDAKIIRLAQIPPRELLRLLARSSVKASQAARHLVIFDAPDVTRGAEAVYADGAAIVAEAFATFSTRKDGVSTLKRVQRVQLTQAGKVGVAFKGGVLNVTLDPEKGLAGRPSSRKVMASLH